MTDLSESTTDKTKKLTKPNNGASPAKPTNGASPVKPSEASKPTNGACPPWCVTGQVNSPTHTHASNDTQVETLAHPLSVQLVQVTDAEPRMLIAGQVATIEQAKRFAYTVGRLADSGTIAERGLSFVVNLVGSSGVTLEEMAAASGLDLDRLRVQQADGQVMTVGEVERLALTVANLAASRNRS